MSIFLIRHASAGRRQPDQSDIDRPLDERGFDQARRVADELDNSDVQFILSSPAIRCRQTVEPLAKVHRLDIEQTDDLWEGRGPGPALALVNRFAAANVTGALCSHGDILPALLDVLADSGVPLDGSGCAKGSIWILDVRDGRIASGSYRPHP